MISSCDVLLNFEQQFEVVKRQLVISLEPGSALLRCTVQKFFMYMYNRCMKFILYIKSRVPAQA